jgi:uncharacterized membrane protein YoaK (UPF0700 family)
MTGNVVFVAFALAGAAGFSLASSLAALAGFLVGAGAGGRLGHALGGDRVRLLAVASSIEIVFVATALLVVAFSDSAPSTAGQAVAAAALAVGTGLQNAVVRRLAVPDLTTTVLTMTLTGIAADVRDGKPGPAFTRRVLAVATMFLGALIGAVIVLQADATVALALATGVVAVVAGAAFGAARMSTASKQGGPR